MQYILYVLLAIIILLVMIVIHELGHYLAGKILKFKINEFSVGFGPKLLQRTSKKTGEKFTLRAIPLGGYCAFEDEDGLAQDKTAEAVAPIDPFADDLTTNDEVNFATIETEAAPNKSFVNEKPWKRIIVLLAGGTFNLISAVLFTFVFILAVGYQTGVVTKIEDSRTLLKVGDEIIAVNGQKIGVMHTYNELISPIGVDETATLTVKRDGVTITVSDVKMLTFTKTDEDGETQTYKYWGVSLKGVDNNGKILDALAYSVPYTGKLAWSILGSFGQLVTGKISLLNLSGPVGTVKMMAEVSRMNWRNILLLLPLIASNLGIFNLLPIPALDGAKVVFTVIEWIRKKPINRNVENMIHMIGLFILLGFVVVVDIVGLIMA